MDARITEHPRGPTTLTRITRITARKDADRPSWRYGSKWKGCDFFLAAFGMLQWRIRSLLPDNKGKLRAVSASSAFDLPSLWPVRAPRRRVWKLPAPQPQSFELPASVLWMPARVARPDAEVLPRSSLGHSPESPLARMERGHGLREIGGREIGPAAIGKVQLGVSALP
jgi:hypothetical protein